MGISKSHLRDLIEANGFIPDHLLGEYLSDKHTVKPNYGYSTEAKDESAQYRAQMDIKAKAAKAAEDKKKAGKFR